MLDKAKRIPGLAHTLARTAANQGYNRSQAMW